MWIALYSLFGLVAGIIVVAGLTQFAPTLIFIDTELVNFRTDLIAIGVCSAGILIGFACGAIKEKGKSIYKNLNFLFGGLAVFGALVGFLFMTGIYGLLYVFGTYQGLTLPLTKAKISWLKDLAAQKQAADPSLTFSDDKAWAGVGISEPIKLMALAEDRALFLLADVRGGFSDSQGNLGPIVRIKDGAIDRSFSVNATDAFHTITKGSKFLTESTVRNQLRYLGELNSGSYLFGGYGLLFALEKSGMRDPEFQVQKDDSLFRAMLEPKQASILVGRTSNPKPVKPDEMIGRFSTGRTAPKPFNITGLEGSMFKVNELHCFTSGSILVAGGFIFDGKSGDYHVLLSPSGKVMWKKPFGSQVREAKKLESPLDKGVYSLPYEKKISVMMVSETGDIEFPLSAIEDKISLPVAAIMPQPDGGLLVVGGFWDEKKHFPVIKLKADGTVDRDYLARIKASSSRWRDSAVVRPVFDSQNNMYLIDDWKGGLIKIFPDGSYDAEFRGKIKNLSDVSAIQMLPDDSLIVGGHFTIKSDDVTYINIACLKTNGDLDKSFLRGIR